MSKELAVELARTRRSVGNEGYIFDRNDPYSQASQVQLVVPNLLESRAFMRSIRQFQVHSNALAIWYLGQNGFVLKSSSGLLVGIDLYLSNSCASKFAHLPYRHERQLPIFIQPEDLDVDVFIATHSHDDHADPETLRRMDKSGTRFVGPFDCMRIYREAGVPEDCCSLTHPGERIVLDDSVSMEATFALPTDATDLNHMGALLRYANGITFYNTGDTAYAEILGSLLPRDMDICAICINGGFHNLSPCEAASIVKQVRPRVVIPCHYDMMINNVGSPAMLKVALDRIASSAVCMMMKYYEPWLYQK